jgi:hypothetical protein
VALTKPAKQSAEVAVAAVTARVHDGFEALTADPEN